MVISEALTVILCLTTNGEVLAEKANIKMQIAQPIFSSHENISRHIHGSTGASKAIWGAGSPAEQKHQGKNFKILC